jgi:hypothetical protein
MRWGTRTDPVEPGTGGPAGNARLTAWTGLVLLVLFLAELVSVFDLEGLIDWHVAVGVLLVPPVLLKTATTGWRVVRYYTNRPAYRRAGPPPMPLRVLGPLVVLFTLALLGSGLLLVAVGSPTTGDPLVTVAGLHVDALLVHKIATGGWSVVTLLHLLGRLAPALRTVRADRAATPVPGRLPRTVVLSLTLTAAVVMTILVPHALAP